MPNRNNAVFGLFYRIAEPDDRVERYRGVFDERFHPLHRLAGLVGQITATLEYCRRMGTILGIVDGMQQIEMRTALPGQSHPVADYQRTE